MIDFLLIVSPTSITPFLIRVQVHQAVAIVNRLIMQFVNFMLIIEEDRESAVSMSCITAKRWFVFLLLKFKSGIHVHRWCELWRREC